MTLKRKAILFVLAVITLLPVPFERVPEFKFILVDDEGVPIPGVTVIQEVTDYTYRSSDPWDRVTTRSGENGEVQFPATTYWMSVGYRAARSAFARVMLLAHGSIGVKCDIFVMEDANYWPTNVARWHDECHPKCEIPAQLSALKKPSNTADER